MALISRPRRKGGWCTTIMLLVAMFEGDPDFRDRSTLGRTLFGIRRGLCGQDGAARQLRADIHLQQSNVATLNRRKNGHSLIYQRKEWMDGS